MLLKSLLKRNMLLSVKVLQNRMPQRRGYTEYIYGALNPVVHDKKESIQREYISLC